MPERTEADGEYETEVEAYQPVQPLPYDHGVTFVTTHAKFDQHLMQILHHGSTVVLWEGVDAPASASAASAAASGSASAAGKGVVLYVRLDRSCGVVTWVRPSWSALRVGGGGGGTVDDAAPDYNLSFNPEETLPPGLLTKLALQAAGETSTGTTLDDG